jgi:magnesium chelatase family protein
MAIAETLSRAQIGLHAPLVHVEVHLAAGLPSFSLVGLPAPVVRESRERVRAAIVNSGYDFPPGRITVNLAPVELAKEGGRYDLPIALGLLRASGQAQWSDDTPIECYGELGLSGELKPVAGLLLAALHAQRAGHRLVLPAANLAEAERVARHRAAGFHSLRGVCGFLATGQPEETDGAAPAPPAVTAAGLDIGPYEKQSSSLDDVLGHWGAKRALCVAAAGGHSLLFVGPPGCGKSLLASRFPALLPPLTEREALEVASIRCIASGSFEASHWGHRPYRAPHHTASANAVLGGGPQLRPGEISLAHCGVLFMDEFPEFDRRVLESLREPLESGRIALARVAGHLELPAEFQLLAAMNPCPCGHLGDAAETCRCSPRAIARYRSRLSGPLWDRIDLRVEITRQEPEQLLPPAAAQTVAAAGPPHEPPAACSEAALRQQVLVAREIQQRRAGCLNARLPVQQLSAICGLEPSARRLLEQGQRSFALSGRGLHRVLRVARTIADLAGQGTIGEQAVAEAFQLRRPLAG